MAVRRSHSHWIREQSSNGGSPVQRDARVDCSARSITGAIWYQGESNEKHAAQYRTLLQAMMACWRRLLFAQGDFPFYIVSLPMYKHHRDTSVEDSWAECAERKRFAAKKALNSCLAVTVDTGNRDTVHPIERRNPANVWRYVLWVNTMARKL